METDNVRRIRPENGSVDDAGGSSEAPVGPSTDDNVISLDDVRKGEQAQKDNVIVIGEYADQADVEGISRDLEEDYIKDQIKKELYNLQALKPTLNKFEQESYTILATDPFFSKCSLRVKLALLRYPPFYLYRMQSTGHHAFIESYEEAKKGYIDRYAKGDITVTLNLKRLWNLDLLEEKQIRFCPLTDLVRLKHRRIAEEERLVSHGAI